MTSSVDEVGRLATAFNHMAAELEEVDRQRRDLVANVSHELRTPIASIRATLENLVDGVTPAEPALLASMLAQVERLQRLVSQLLDLARLESGGSPAPPGVRAARRGARGRGGGGGHGGQPDPGAGVRGAEGPDRGG